MSTISRPADVFGLDMLAEHLAGFQPPPGPHDPAGDWQLEYRAYALAATYGLGGQAGSLRLSRTRQPGDMFRLEVECRKPAGNGCTCRLAAQVEARLAALPVPRRWTWTGEILAAAPGAPPLSRLTRSATLDAGVLTLAPPPRKIPLPGPCSINWLLWEAVGRLPREPLAPLAFSMLHDFDRPLPHHTLHYAQSVSLLLGERPVRQTKVEELEKGRITSTFWGTAGGRMVRLHVYHHLGDGSVPWVYWVDEHGRVLLAVSGFEAYVLNSVGTS